MARPIQVHLTSYENAEGKTLFRLRWSTNWEQGLTREQAEERKADIERLLRRGERPTSARGTGTLSEFADFHFRTAGKSLGTKPLAPNTKTGYRKLVRLNMDAVLEYPDPYDERPLAKRRTKKICLGRMMIKHITTDVVQEWVWAVEQSRGASQRAKAFRCLGGIMTRALTMGEITSHPCRGIQGASAEPDAERPEVDEDVPWLLAEALRDYRDCYGRPSRDRYAAIPIVIGYGLGARKSEIRGLKRRDIKLGMEETRIKVERQAYFVDPAERDPDAESGWDTEAKTKTKKSKRTLYIYGAALEALSQHMETYMRPEEEDPEGEDLVFTGPRGGPISDTSWNTAWVEARAAARAMDKRVPEDLHLHDLRHHAATAVAEDTKDLKHIQNFLGDNTTAAALRYLDVTDDHRREMGRKMGARFAKYRRSAPSADVVQLRKAQ